jgi:hypothetical protein
MCAERQIDLNQAGFATGETFMTWLRQSVMTRRVKTQGLSSSPRKMRRDAREVAQERFRRRLVQKDVSVRRMKPRRLAP